MERKFVEFTIEGFEAGFPGPDGKNNLLKLAFDFNEIVDAEALSGCNLFYAIANPTRMTAAQLRGLVYACLKPATYDEKKKTASQLTMQEAGDLISLDLKAVTTALAKCLAGDATEEVEIASIQIVGEEAA